MIVEDLLNKKTHNPYEFILKECSQFLTEADGNALYKYLPNNYSDVHKVKVRLQRNKNNFTDTFNETFNFTNLRQRAIYAMSELCENREENLDSFYIFPKDGFKFLYSKEIKNSEQNFQNAFDVILDSFTMEDEANGLIKDLLQYTYMSTKLIEGIESGSEIIFYNIPYYYAVRTSIIEYDSLLSKLV